MKNVKCLVLSTTLAAALLATSAPVAQNGVHRDLMDTVMSVHQFDTFLTLVRDADLTFNLKGSGPFTIFAPTNEAFDKMPAGLLDRIHGDKSLLRQFVQHHIVRGSWTAERAVRAHSLATLSGSTLTTRNVNGRGWVGQRPLLARERAYQQRYVARHQCSEHAQVRVEKTPHVGHGTTAT